jgi:hypothetical protein
MITKENKQTTTTTNKQTKNTYTQKQKHANKPTKKTNEQQFQ